MKKSILLLAVVVIATGLVLLGKQGGSASGKEIKVHSHKVSTISLPKKEFIKPAISLIDSRNGKEIQKIKTSTFTTKEDAKKMVQQFEAKYDQPMIPAKLTIKGTLKPGKPRIVLDKEALSKNLENVIAFQKEIVVPISESAPNVSSRSIRNISQRVVGSYTTKFNSSVTGRTTNISLSAQALNGVILGPGDRFYFNLFVGERTSAKGYQKAKEIVNKQFVEGIGGGICQTSTTLYNAVERAGLGIMELHHHSKHVGYVPINRDATVSYGGKDFKFENNKNYPILIRTIMNRQGGTLQVQVTAAVQ